MGFWGWGVGGVSSSLLKPTEPDLKKEKKESDLPQLAGGAVGVEQVTVQLRRHHVAPEALPPIQC